MRVNSKDDGAAKGVFYNGQNLSNPDIKGPNLFCLPILEGGVYIIDFYPWVYFSFKLKEEPAPVQGIKVYEGVRPLVALDAQILKIDDNSTPKDFSDDTYYARYQMGFMGNTGVVPFCPTR